jgi:hypothetical protein
MKDEALQADEETPITEISFLPDGRVRVFGMSREVLQVLGELALGDRALARRYERLRDAELNCVAEATKPAGGGPTL